jgi:hypothetical protein
VEEVEGRVDEMKEVERDDAAEVEGDSKMSSSLRAVKRKKGAVDSTIWRISFVRSSCEKDDIGR